jgi:hypothetical protein
MHTNIGQGEIFLAVFLDFSWSMASSTVTQTMYRSPGASIGSPWALCCPIRACCPTSEDSDSSFSYFIFGLRTRRKSNIIQIPLGVWNCFKTDYASIWSELSTCKIFKGTEKIF